VATAGASDGLLKSALRSEERESAAVRHRVSAYARYHGNRVDRRDVDAHGFTLPMGEFREEIVGMMMRD
jgi:hypothetical protein